MKKVEEFLSPTQKKVMKPRRCVYDGEKKNTDPQIARDIISLYVTCKLGYSAIRHILGLPNDKKIEDVIRQHMLGRKGVDGNIGELYCPGSTEIEESCKHIISNMIQQYGTSEDQYNIRMMSTDKWFDDPVYMKINKCKKCGESIESNWKICPFCGQLLQEFNQHKLW